MKRRPWKRLAHLRAGRRRGTELPPPERDRTEDPVPPPEPPEDREFLSLVAVGGRLQPEAA